MVCIGSGRKLDNKPIFPLPINYKQLQDSIKMGLREFLAEVKVEKIFNEVDPKLEIAGILNENSDKVFLFEKIKNSPYKVVGGVCSSRENFARALGVEREELIHRISDAISNPTKPKIANNAPCQEVVEEEVNLSNLPILTHTDKDMGPYITAGVFIANDKEFGPNLSFHRTSPISENKLVARICDRDLNSYMQRAGGELDISICIGLHPSVLLAAGISIGIKANELEIANSLKPVELVKCKTNDIMVPADSEIVLEGRMTKEKHEEGPFPDITRTYDIVRKEPVIEINCITHRQDSIYQALLPASPEHELLMGMPKEPVIFNAVNKVCSCRNVLLSHGGCSWLHAAIQIDKKNSDDGKKAIEEAFKAHKSLKHLVVVDSDVDIYSPEEVEWAIATRFQADKDMVAFRELGSSLDPSAEDDCSTCKVGVDATIPSDKEKNKFRRIELGE